MINNLIYMALLNASLSMGGRFSWLTSAIVSRFAKNSEHGCLGRFQNSYLAFIGDPTFVPDTKTLLILSDLSVSALVRGDLPARYKIESIIQDLPGIASDEALRLRSMTRVVLTDFVKGRFDGSFAQLNRIEKALAELPESGFTFGSENYRLFTQAFGALYLKWFDRVENAACRACRRSEKRYGMRSLESIGYKQLLVEVYLGRGEFEKARELISEILIVQKHYLKPGSLDLAATYLAAAALDAETGNFDQAENSLALVEKAYGRTTVDSTYIDLAHLYVGRARLAYCRGDRKGCFEFASRALLEFASHFPEDHPVQADALAYAALCSEGKSAELKVKLERIVGKYKMNSWNLLEQLRREVDRSA